MGDCGVISRNVSNGDATAQCQCICRDANTTCIYVRAGDCVIESKLICACTTDITCCDFFCINNQFEGGYACNHHDFTELDRCRNNIALVKRVT